MAGFPARTASFPTKRAAERWAKTVEAEMIEGKHFRNSAARRRTLGAAIDRYLLEEVPKKRDGSMHHVRLPWWKEHAGNVKLAEVTPADRQGCDAAHVCGIGAIGGMPRRRVAETHVARRRPQGRSVAISPNEERRAAAGLVER